ncbi:MAG TPA: TolC family protein, partial [Rhodopila sp.]
MLFAVCAVAACTVGPDFHPPAADVPAAWKDPSASTPGSLVTPHADPDPRWWRAFNDPTLDSLIDRAAAGNISFQQTIYR